MKKFITITCCFLLCLSAFAQKKSTAKPATKIYVTTTDMFYGNAQCYYSPAKYTPEMLKNAETLCAGLTSYSMFWVVKIDRGNLSDEEYSTKIRDYFATCKLPAGVVWENMRKQGLQKFDYEIKLDKLKKEADKDPSVLKSSEFSEYCTEYIDALNGTDEEIMAAWKKLYTGMSKNNADPDRIMREFKTKSNSADWKKSAKSDLMSFGWGNCMNDIEHQGKFYDIADQTKVMQTFRKLFVRIVEEEI